MKSLDPQHMTRAHRILSKSKPYLTTNLSAKKDIVNIAGNLGIQVRYLDEFKGLFDENDGKQRREMERMARKVIKQAKKRNARRKLKAPFLKVEDRSMLYQPLIKEMDSWPRIYYDSVQPNCPFDPPPAHRTLKRKTAHFSPSSSAKRKAPSSSTKKKAPSSPVKRKALFSSAKRKAQSSSAKRKAQSSSAKRKALSSSAKRKALSSSVERKTPPSSAKRKGGVAKAKVRLSSNKNVGFCELCGIHYKGLKQHLRGAKHRNNASNRETYREFDDIARQGRSAGEYMESVESHYRKNNTNVERWVSFLL